MRPGQVRWPQQIESVLTWRVAPSPVPQRSDDDEGLLREFYVKWQTRPHMEDAWISGRWLVRVSFQRYMHFQRKMMPPLPVDDVVDKARGSPALTRAPPYASVTYCPTHTLCNWLSPHACRVHISAGFIPPPSPFPFRLINAPPGVARD